MKNLTTKLLVLVVALSLLVLSLAAGALAKYITTLNSETVFTMDVGKRYPDITNELGIEVSAISGSPSKGFTITLKTAPSGFTHVAYNVGSEIKYAEIGNQSFTIQTGTQTEVTLEKAKMYAFATLDSGLADLKIYNRLNRIAAKFTPDNMDKPAHTLLLPKGKPSASSDPEGGSTTWVNTASTDSPAGDSNFRVKVKTVTFQDPISPTSTRWWFNCFRSCTSFTFVKDGKTMLDTSQVTDMGCMFRYCNAVTKLDLSTFNTAKVTDMERMFSENKALTSLNLSGWNTANVTDMASMFWTCSVLKELNISHFNTANVTTMYQMFGYCPQLTHLNLTSFQTSNVTTMANMFIGATNLRAIKIGSGWKTAATATDVFKNSTALVYLDGQLGSNTVTYTGWDSTNSKANFAIDGYIFTDDPNEKRPAGDQTYPTFGGSTHLAGAVLRSELTNRVEYSEKSKYTISISSADSGGTWDSHVLTLAPAKMYAFATLPTESTAANPGALNLYYRLNRISDTFTPDNMPGGLDIYNLYDYWKSFVSDKANPKGVNHWMGLRSTKDANGNDTKDSRVGSVTVQDTIPLVCSPFIFQRLSNCTSIDLRGLDTSAVTDMQGLFGSCNKLTTLNLTGIQTHNVIYMNSMFSGCNALKNLDLSGFDTSKVTDMSSMFYGCRALTSLNVSSFDTSKVKKMNNMFQNLEITSLDVTNFNTSNVTTMRSMFNSSSKLQSIDVSGFDTSAVTSMSYMFKSCSGLTSLDLSSFDTSKVTGMYQMFYYCPNLTTITVGDGWNTKNVPTGGDADNGSTDMFSSFKKLVGQNGTKYTASYVDVTYAREDYGPSSTLPGYLTHVDAKNYAFATIDNLGVGAGTMRVYTRKIVLPAVGTTWDDGSGNTYTVAGLYKLPNGNPSGYVSPDGVSAWTTLQSSQANKKDSKVKAVEFVDTCSPTSTASWFERFENCTSMNLAKLDTSNVTTMYAMFNFVQSLPSIDVTHFNTGRVRSMQSMFAQCYKLTELDLSSFTTSQGVTITSMFNWSHKIKTIYVGDGWNPTTLTVDNGAPFYETRVLVGGNGTKHDSENKNVGKEYARVDGLDGKPGYFTYGGKHATKVYLLCEINGVTADKTELTANSSNEVTLTNASLMTCIVSSNKNPTPKSLEIDDGKITIPADYCAPGQVVRLTDPADFAFATLDSSNHLRIYNRKGLLPEVNEEFDGYTVSAVYKWPCGKPDASDDPLNVTGDWMAIRQQVKTVTVVDDIYPVSTRQWFNGFTSCTSYNLAKLHTDYVTNMLGMFNGTTIATLDLSHFNTGNVTDMNSMFANAKFTELDLSSFNTANVENMGWMFSGDKELTKITVGDNWTIANVTTDTSMFSNCISLKGGSGTAFDNSKIGKEYARVDGGTDAPGYLTHIDQANQTLNLDMGSIAFVFADEGQTHLIPGVDNTLLLIAAEGEALPEQLVVTIDGVEYMVPGENDIRYDHLTGELILPGTLLTETTQMVAIRPVMPAPITIDISGIDDTGLEWLPISGHEDMMPYPGEDYVISFAAKAGYALPESITVTIDGTSYAVFTDGLEHREGSDLPPMPTFDPASGLLTIPAILLTEETQTVCVEAAAVVAEAEAPACICEIKCTDLNDGCEVCRADITACVGKEPETAAACGCTVKCAEGAENADCEVCAADMAACIIPESEDPIEETGSESVAPAITVNTDGVSNLSFSPDADPVIGQNYTAALTADEGYTLPETIAVTIGADPYTVNLSGENEDGKPDFDGGKLIIPGTLLTGETTITIEAAGVAVPADEDSSGEDPQPPADNSTQPPADNSTQPPADNSTQPPADNSTQPPADDSAQPPADDGAQPPTDGSAQPPADDSAQPPADGSTPADEDIPDESEQPSDPPEEVTTEDAALPPEEKETPAEGNPPAEE